MDISPYKATIGLEIHAELKTKTKMFCNSKNDPDETNPNVNICPVCMGYPGTLPVINKEAVRHVLRVGTALGGSIADFTEFDRKNYFYPDIPKGYQISQYKYPLVSGGSLNGVSITRVHLEEDTARSSHEGAIGSMVDFNRAGVPLMELVTEPVLHSGEEASSFAKELQLLLQYLEAGDANMEKGEMRVEANISISKTDSFGTKVEVKNLNSFKAVEKAIAFEISRHKEILERGERVLQETRGWDEKKEVTFSQRTKEDSHDYRYFPDPDLPKLRISEVEDFSSANIRASLPELPWDKRKRYVNSFGLKSEDIEVYVRLKEWAKYFEDSLESISDASQAQILSNFITSDLMGLFKNNAQYSVKEVFHTIPPDRLRALIGMFTEGTLNSRSTKDILKMMFDGEKGAPEEIAEKHNLLQKNDSGFLEEVVSKIIEENPSVVEDFRNGKVSALQFLIGQGMKLSKGSANPKILQEIIKKKIS